MTKNSNGGKMSKKTKQWKLTISFDKDEEESQRCYEKAVRCILKNNI